jgi:hypothetical protein
MTYIHKVVGPPWPSYRECGPVNLAASIAPLAGALWQLGGCGLVAAEGCCLPKALGMARWGAAGILRVQVRVKLPILARVQFDVQ